MNAYSIKQTYRDGAYTHTFYAEDEKQARFIADILQMYFGGKVEYDGQLIETGDICEKCGHISNIKSFEREDWPELI